MASKNILDEFTFDQNLNNINVVEESSELRFAINLVLLSKKASSRCPVNYPSNR